MTSCGFTRTILCVWEIGGDLGHIYRLSKIARTLTAEGHKVVVALKDCSRAHSHFEPDILLFQAPVWLPKISMQRPIACLADSLLLSGYLELEGLRGLVRNWQSLVAAVNPDVMIYDYAPTAALATRHLAVPKIRIGNGFADAEPGCPMADWRPEAVKPTGGNSNALIAKQEAVITRTINTLLGEQGLPPIRYFADIFSGFTTVIDTFPELDIYNRYRKNTVHCVRANTNNSFPKIQFNQQKPKKIVAYLKAWQKHLNVLIHGLHLCDADVHIVCPQLNTGNYTQLLSDHFHITTELIDLPHAMAHADLFVGHGNTGSLTESLYLGTPVASLPEQLEQYIFAKKVHDLGLGVLIDKVGSADVVANQINTVLLDNTIKARINNFTEQSILNRAPVETLITEIINNKIAL